MNQASIRTPTEQKSSQYTPKYTPMSSEASFCWAPIHKKPLPNYKQGLVVISIPHDFYRTETNMNKN